MAIAILPKKATSTRSIRVPSLNPEVERVSALLSEYKDVLLDYITNGKRHLPRKLLFAARELAQYASGLIEDSNLSRLDKLELQLRNAEVEAVLSGEST